MQGPRRWKDGGEARGCTALNVSGLSRNKINFAHYGRVGMPKPWVKGEGGREIVVHIENYNGPPDNTWCGIEDDEAATYPERGEDTLMVQDFAIQDAARKCGKWEFVRCAQCVAALKAWQAKEGT